MTPKANREGPHNLSAYLPPPWTPRYLSTHRLLTSLRIHHSHSIRGSVSFCHFNSHQCHNTTVDSFATEIVGLMIIALVPTHPFALQFSHPVFLRGFVVSWFCTTTQMYLSSLIFLLLVETGMNGVVDH